VCGPIPLAALACRTSTAQKVALQAGTRSRVCGPTHAAEADAAHGEAAALHYLRTREEVIETAWMDLESVSKLLRLDAVGMSACGDCNRCEEGASCKRVANREAARHGKRGALWAEEAEQLMDRTFQVCRLHSCTARCSAR
jgi:hypothetical protein